MDDFKLSASLVGHDDDVRAVIFPFPNTVVSASRDATVRVWKKVSEPLPTFEDTIIQHGSSFINALAYLQPTSDYIEGLVVSGGKDSIIEARQPNRPADDAAEGVLLGHASNVCALDVNPASEFVVSGGWDAQARLWTVGNWETEVLFEGHEGSVWAVLAYDSETIITGCADNLIRIFHISGKLLRTVKGSTDVVRALCRVPKGHPSGAAFASAGNDGIIRLWSLEGVQVDELHGHDNFIYSLASLPTGELVSSGEDRTVRIWKGSKCIQTITHPAISVWSVAANPDNGDIVTGASDRVVRVFTRVIHRVADDESLAAFEESVKTSSIPQQAAGEINKEALPSPDFLVNKSGTKDGQVQMIKEHDGSITAHQWSSGQQQWVSIGTVADSVGSSGKKTSYLGKDYDYVFDVDIEEGKPALKLPYNLSENPYERATKFIADNELPMSYIDQVANFITTNTQGASLGAAQDQGPAPAGSDPWGSENRYRPGGGSAPSPPVAPKILPQKEYLSILVARVDVMENKIKELNHQLITSGAKDISLNPEELSILSTLRSHLEASGSTSTSQSVAGGLDLAIKLTKEWPYASRLPGLDLLRLLAVAPNTATYRSPRGATIVDVLEASIAEQQPPAENNTMLAVRAFANLFASPEGRGLAAAEFDKIFAVAAAAVTAKTANRNLLVALTTLAINYAVLVTAAPEDAPEVSGAARFEHALAWLELLAKMLAEQKDSEVLYRALIAVGTFLGVAPEVRSAAKEVYGIDAAVATALGKAVDPRVKNVGREIRELLK